MSIIIKDADNGNGFFSGPIIVNSKEEFLIYFPGELPNAANDNEPEQYPAVVYETTTRANWGGREYTHFVFFYDFEEVDE